MNYLGHIYLSGNDTSLMQANLYGDFIKGSNLSDLDPEIEKGIRLHRAIDHFIDNHKAVHELLPILRTDLPKVAGIAIDIYFDHLLAKNWQTFHPQPYADYLNVVYNNLNIRDKRYNTDYLLFLERLLQYRWINHYPNLDAVDRMSKNISSQLSFPNQLLHGKSVFLIHEKTITEAFFDYMRSANEHFLTEKLRILS